MKKDKNRIGKTIYDHAYHLRVNKIKPTPVSEYITFVRVPTKLVYKVTVRR